MLHTVFYFYVVRSIGQVDEMEFDDICQRDDQHELDSDSKMNTEDIYKI